MNYEKKYKDALERAKEIHRNEDEKRFDMEWLFPELKENENERIRKEIIRILKGEMRYVSKEDTDKYIAWLEKQGKETSWKPSKEEMDVLYGLAYITNQYDEHKEEVITRLYQDLKREFFNGSSYENMFPTNTCTEDDVRRRSTIQVLEYARSLDAYNQYGKADIDKNIAWLEKQEGKHLENYDEAEKEKADFVGDGFIECHADFLDFKEGNTYWLEYVGDDMYNVRSDNLLDKTYHITPCQLYTVFKKLTWLETQGEQSVEPKWYHHNVDLSDCSEEYRKAYYDGWNNCNMQHSQCETESNDEDEKIRKWLIGYFQQYRIDGMEVVYANSLKVDNILAWLEKQREQKSVWSEEDEKFFNDIVGFFEDKKNAIDHSAWIKSLRQRIVG